MAGIGASRVFQPEPRRTPPGHDNDPFLHFNSEVPEPAPPPTPPPAPEPPPFLATNLQTLQEQLRAPQKAETQRVGPPQGLAPITIGLCVGLAGIMTAGVLYFQLGRQQAAAERPAPLVKATVETHGTLTVTSNPEGSRVFVNGKLQGATPLTMSLPVGAHELELRNGSSSRKIPLNIAGGETISQVIDLEPGVQGFVSFKSPVTMRVSEAGHTVGTTDGKISLSPGRHDLDLSSNSLDFRRQVTVHVNSGQTTTATIDPPEGVVFINALPWANVLIDGKPVGTTPLGNLKVPIGEHEITWRHPTFGQRRMTVRVSAKSPLRVSVDYKQ
jgi:PEGA domain-containing protein